MKQVSIGLSVREKSKFIFDIVFAIIGLILTWLTIIADFLAAIDVSAKPLGCYGDAGAVFTNNSEYAER